MNKNEALALLGDRERRVVELRIGIGDTRPRTLLETSIIMSKEEDWNVSRARVRIIQNRAFAKIGRTMFLEMMGGVTNE